MQGSGVGRNSTDNNGNIKLIDEAFEVEGLCTRGDMLGRNRRPTDHEEINTRLDNSAPIALGPLGGKLSGDHDSRVSDVLEAFGDEISLDGCRIDLLKPRDRTFGGELGNLIQDRLRIFVTSPQTIQV